MALDNATEPERFDEPDPLIWALYLDFGVWADPAQLYPAIERAMAEASTDTPEEWADKVEAAQASLTNRTPP